MDARLQGGDGHEVVELQSACAFSFVAFLVREQYHSLVVADVLAGLEASLICNGLILCVDGCGSLRHSAGSALVGNLPSGGA